MLQRETKEEKYTPLVERFKVTALIDLFLKDASRYTSTEAALKNLMTCVNALPDMTEEAS